MQSSEKSEQKILEFIPSKKYIDNLEKELSYKFNKVTFYYFKIMAEEYFLRIAKKLFEALENGQKVELQLDAVFSKINLDGGGFYYPLTAKGREKNKLAIEKNLKLFKELEEKGAKITFFNEPNFLLSQIPFAKRDHRKVIIIQRLYGSVAYFGATNFCEEDKNDFMIKIHDHNLAEKIGEISSLDFIQSQKEDYILEINENLKFFLDIGKNFRSKIQKQAYGMITRARKEVVFVSQLSPEISLLWHFILARINGAKVKFLLPPFKNKNLMGFPFIFFYWMNLFFAKIFGIQITHCFGEYSHSKILICDDNLLLGSHNLSSAGVMFGTVEFSAFIRDQKISKSVHEFIDYLEGKKDLTKNLAGKDFANP